MVVTPHNPLEETRLLHQPASRAFYCIRVSDRSRQLIVEFSRCLQAGYLKNEGKPNAKATSLAKWQSTTRSEKAASMAIEVHGANGYSNDYPVERYLRNCKAAIIYEGTRDIHTLMQADWALGLKKEKPARKTLPVWKK